VLTHDADHDHDRGQELVAAGATLDGATLDGATRDGATRQRAGRVVVIGGAHSGDHHRT